MVYAEFMARVESFELDHTRVHAPYVRLAARGEGLSKWDLRLAQPNKAAIPTDAMHTLEHLLATYIRDHLEGVFDLSPMGCRTGFYMTVVGAPSEEEVRAAFEAALKDVLDHEGPVPGVSPLTCGNYRDHDLKGAKAWAKRVLDAGIRVQEAIPLP